MTSGALPLAPRIRPQPRLAERMRDHGTDKLVLGFGLLWMIYVVTQFRMPWHELTYTEDTPDSGMRQFFFPLGAAIALRRMLYTGTTHRILGMHLGGLLLGLLMVAVHRCPALHQASADLRIRLPAVVGARAHAEMAHAVLHGNDRVWHGLDRVAVDRRALRVP
jgi:hypothetical protein